MSEVLVEATAQIAGSTIAADIANLCASFGCAELSTERELLDFAQHAFDFRNGRSREDTPWREGLPFTLLQKEATLEAAQRLGMMHTSEPVQDFDHIVVLGGFKDTLNLRTQHAVDIAQQRQDKAAHLILLSCFRPIHPKEGVLEAKIATERDLAVDVLQNIMQADFKVEAVQSWDDQPKATERAKDEYGVAYIGKIGLHPATIISGSVPGSRERATTASTLESLKTHLEESLPRLLFVTTSLHLPYQAQQISKVMQGYKSEVVGVSYDWMRALTVESEDVHFRVILQEIGATIKNHIAL